MLTVLLTVIYIAFIGLGIPDSLFGPAWPAIRAEFSLPVSYASFVTVLISACTVVSSLISARIINRFGTGHITAVSTCITAFALLGFSVSGEFIFLCLLAVPLGLGAGTIDAALNNYVALHFKAIHMNFLHCFYGIGVTLSPYIMSLSLKGGSWRTGYRTAFFIQLAITAICVLSLPLWGKVSAVQDTDEDIKPVTVGVFTLLRQHKVRCAGLIFFAYCAVEAVAGTWASTFLVGARGVELDTAARMVTLYYGGMALGRLISGLLSGRLSSWCLIQIGETFTFAAIVLLMLPTAPFWTGAGLLLIGIGNGPIFPNMIHQTPHSFGKELSQSVISAQMACAYVGSMAMPPIFGILAQNVGTWLYPYYLLVLFIIMAAATLLLSRQLKREHRL